VRSIARRQSRPNACIDKLVAAVRDELGKSSTRKGDDDFELLVGTAQNPG